MITTSTDLYSLGVLLSKLLIGLHPFELGNLSYKEIENIVLEENPKPASRRYSAVTNTDLKNEIADQRNTSPQSITRQLHGDLDAIIYKAVHKDPDRRYASVEALVTDLERYQNELPVFARPDTFLYRAKKFANRNRWGIAAITIIFLVLIGGFFTTMWQAQEAEKNAREAEQVSDFLAQIFEGSDPNRANDGSMTARELLDQGFERAQTELVDEPGLQAQMLSMIGNIYSNLGLYDDAFIAVEKSVELFQGIGDDSPNLATALLRLANLEYRLSNFEAAAEAARQSLDLNINQYGDDHPEVASVMNTLAMSLEEIGEKEEAYEMYYRIIDIRRGQPDQGSNLAVNLNNLAILLQEDGRLDEADVLFREAVGLIDEVLGEQHPFMAYTLNGYSGVHQDRGEYDQAEADLRRALEIGRAVFPPEHPFIAVVLHNLGGLFDAMEAYDDAVDYYNRGLELRQQTLPPAHPDIAISMEAIGGVLVKAGQPEEAEPVLRDALAIQTESYAEGDPRIARVESILARSLLYQGNRAEARQLLEKSLPVLEEELGSDNIFTERAKEDLSTLN
jgi:serine/threonine-protein kinase